MLLAAFLGVSWRLCCSQQPTSEAAEYQRAEAFVRAHAWDDGLAVLTPLLERNPVNVKALNLAGLASTGKGDIDAADRYFEHALGVDAKFLPALKNLGINEFNRKQAAAAEKHLRAALHQSPGDPVVNLYLGELAYDRKDYLDAVEALAKAGPFLSRDPNLSAQLAVGYLAMGDSGRASTVLDAVPVSGLTAESQFSVGSQLAKAGLFDRAVPFLEAARETHPESYDISFDLAWSYLSLKQYPKAIEVIQAAIERKQDTAELEQVLGEAYEGNKQTQAAVDALRRAVALAPDDEEGYLEFARICIDHQDFPAARKVLEAGLRIHPKSDQLLFERGIFYAMQDNFALAQKDFEEAALLAPDKDSSYAGLGVLFLETGNAAQAVQTLRKRLQEKPDDANLLYLLGEALLRTGAHSGEAAFSEARLALERSIKLEPHSCLPHVALGKIYLEEDRVNDAVSQLELARAIDPKEKSTYWQLAVAYRKLGQTAKQKEALNALKELGESERGAPRAVGKSSQGPTAATTPN